MAKELGREDDYRTFLERSNRCRRYYDKETGFMRGVNADGNWKTHKLVDSILHSLYFNEPDGISGNEDCGQMSAWYILNAMGIYSVCPGNPVYSIGRPVFDEVGIQLEDGKVFIIKTFNNSKENCYVQSASLRGEALNLPYLSHEEILRGGILEIRMGNRPNKSWGTTN